MVIKPITIKENILIAIMVACTCVRMLNEKTRCMFL